MPGVHIYESDGGNQMEGVEPLSPQAQAAMRAKELWSTGQFSERVRTVEEAFDEVEAETGEDLSEARREEREKAIDADAGEEWE